jgi:hypothetical protein
MSNLVRKAPIFKDLDGKRSYTLTDEGLFIASFDQISLLDANSTTGLALLALYQKTEKLIATKWWRKFLYFCKGVKVIRYDECNYILVWKVTYGIGISTNLLVSKSGIFYAADELERIIVKHSNDVVSRDDITSLFQKNIDEVVSRL